MSDVQTGGFRILKNRQALSGAVAAAISSVSVQHEINLPTMFSFTLNIVSPTGAWQDVNLDAFAPGDAISIWLGIDQPTQLVNGEITAIEPHFSQYSSATIRGFDRMYRLRFGTRTRTYQQASDNDIAAQVASAAGLTIRAQGRAGIVNDYVLQNNQSDYDFLMSRCAQINHELLMDDTTLVFRPSAEGGSPVRTLNFPADVDDLELALRLPTLGKQVTVSSYDIVSNQPLSATASSGTAKDRMGGTETGYQAADGFPDSAVRYERPNINSPEALQAVAAAQYQRNLAGFIEGRTSVLGDASLVAGINVRLTGLSQRFNGIYYVTSSTHTYDVEDGYQTEFTLRRTGI
ncbi:MULTISPECIES: contractile injection system protein, VgrG/Pvc8 family [unclassified Burkholderia]|uniref:phage late control D family protein n=1 Tax=unclassified Burkholderia TaxID=2613784 RepID=UPI001422A4ED|nr:MULTISPECIES: contractile injection system protein, VgrG/Pvc8 family [unclassified Burkholderia]NIF72322.1 phage late control D family protein [Burkholderia sp. Ap-962]NIF93283.1 phage late control D family protein [Burkholderia sp. Cy-637]